MNTKSYLIFPFKFQKTNVLMKELHGQSING
ncbi:MAG: hypothetical protein UZ08_BCD001000469 [Candidatus Parvibacillus calidus]|nr:MAG: hypothetical protein UZ08_BCD001000469 [Candidatus Parvibacillus calidus]